MEPKDFTIQTKTPIWTGGINPDKMDRVHETGLLGSLRWWYEVILRGLGARVCDPSEHSCLLDPVKYQEGKSENMEGPALLSHAGLCAGCQVFGATGWRRRFRLTVKEKPGVITQLKSTKSPTGDRYKENSESKRPNWYFFGGYDKEKEFQLKVEPLSATFDPIIVHGILRFIEQHGGLAAKTQLGYGQIRITEPTKMDVAKFISQLNQLLPDTVTPPRELPALTNMFFAQVKTAYQNIEATLNLRYDVRAAFRQSIQGVKAREVRHFICGTVAKKREGSKIFYSQEVDDVMRVWGWIPDPLPNSLVEGATRDEIVSLIHNALKKFGSIISWREYNSPRDMKEKNNTDKTAFLRNLLEPEPQQES